MHSNKPTLACPPKTQLLRTLQTLEAEPTFMLDLHKNTAVYLVAKQYATAHKHPDEVGSMRTRLTVTPLGLRLLAILRSTPQVPVTPEQILELRSAVTLAITTALEHAAVSLGIDPALLSAVTPDP